MHESLQRLLEAARSATARRPLHQRVTTTNDLERAMNVSPQVMHNWKKRGVSEAGAIEGEALFGCPAVWTLRGVMPAFAPLPLPLSSEVINHIRGLSNEDVLHAENVLRATLRLKPLEAPVGKRMAA